MLMASDQATSGHTKAGTRKPFVVIEGIIGNEASPTVMAEKGSVPLNQELNLVLFLGSNWILSCAHPLWKSYAAWKSRSMGDLCAPRRRSSAGMAAS